MNFFRIYDRLAQTYDFAIGPLLSHGHRMAFNAMDLKPGMKMLEVGIGTGLTLTKIPQGLHVTGIDLSGPMLEKAQNRVKELGLADHVSLFHMSAEAMEFKDNSFDAVFAPSVFSVADNPDKVLDEMVRVCKPDGVICVVSHFAGKTWPEKIYDKIFDPFTRKLVGYRMTTPREVVEKHGRSRVVLTQPIFTTLNFGTLYLLKKN